MNSHQAALAGLRARFIGGLPARRAHIEALLLQHYAGHQRALAELRRETHSLVGAAGIHGLARVASAANSLNQALACPRHRVKVEQVCATLVDALSNPDVLTATSDETPAVAPHRIVVLCQGVDELLTLNEQFERAGHDVRAFNSRQSFSHYMQRAPAPALLVLGLQFGDSKFAGLDCLAAVRHVWPDTRILVTSANDSLTARRSAYRAGAERFIAKPFEPDDMLRQVQALLNGSGRGPERALFLGQCPLAWVEQGGESVGSLEAALDALTVRPSSALILGQDADALPLAALTRLLCDHPQSRHLPVFWVASEEGSDVLLDAMAAGAQGVLNPGQPWPHVCRQIQLGIATCAHRHAMDVQLRAALYEQAQLNRALEHHTVISLADAEGLIVRNSDRLSALRGYPEHALIGSHLCQTVPKKAPPELPPEAFARAREGHDWRGEVSVPQPDGTLSRFDLSLVPFLDGEGRAYQYLLARTDISRLVESELALEQARQAELATASVIQQTLLVPRLPACPDGIGVASCFRASQGVAGDFHHLIPWGEGCFDVLVGDVMGKGVPAALIAAAVKFELAEALSDLRKQQSGTPPPTRIVSALDERVNQRLMHLGCFVTLGYLRVDNLAKRLISVGCGHPPALVWHSGGVTRVPGLNPPLGVMQAMEYSESELELPDGAVIALYSDGLTEAQDLNGDDYGETRLVASLEHLAHRNTHAESVASGMFAAVEAHSAGRRDDQTLIVISIPTKHERYASLPRSFASLAPLRNLIKTYVHQQGLDAMTGERLSLASVEYVSNLVRHGRAGSDSAQLSLRLSHRDGYLELCLSDDGTAYSPLRPGGMVEPSPFVESGRGLYLLHVLCDAMDYRSEAGIHTLTLRASPDVIV